jgi:hypothetical protein
MSVAKLNSLFLTVLVLGLIFVSAVLSCGELLDGQERGKDIDKQTDTSKYWVNWEGFSEDEDVEIAIISEHIAFKAVFDHVNCRKEPGFCGDPDVYDFHSVKHNLGEHSIDNLDLQVGERYYAIIKFRAGKEWQYANSDGLVIEKGKDHESNDDNNDDDDKNPPPAPPARSSHGDGSSSSDDDDDDLEDWEIGLIAMGCALCCLLLLLLILLVVAKGKGEDKYTTTVHRNDNVDKL